MARITGGRKKLSHRRNSPEVGTEGAHNLKGGSLGVTTCSIEFPTTDSIFVVNELCTKNDFVANTANATGP